MDILDDQRGSGFINLSDMYIGDEGAVILANFQRNCPTIKSLNLRGNKISPSGFVSIFGGLMDNQILSELSLEWNDMGKDSSGQIQLAEYAKIARSLRKLDLRNNGISGQDTDSIGKVIRDCKTLVYIDLRWNALGNKGGKILLDAIQTNNSLLKVEQNGNTISDDILTQIGIELEEHIKQDPNGLRNYEDIFMKTVGGTSANFYSGGHSSSIENTGGHDKRNEHANERDIMGAQNQHIGDRHGHDPNNQRDRDRMAQEFSREPIQVEKILHEERHKSQHTKEVLMKQLDGFMKKDQEGAQIVRELEARYYDSMHDVENLKRENERYREDYLKARDELQIKESRWEDRLRGLEFELVEANKENKIQVDKLMADYAVATKESNREWEKRIDELERRVKGSQCAKEEAEMELQRQTENMSAVKLEHQLEMKDMLNRMKKDLENEYEDKSRCMEVRIGVLEEKREKHMREVVDNYKESSFRESKIQEQLLKTEGENNVLLADKKNFEARVEELTDVVERLKEDLGDKERLMVKLEDENSELHRVLQGKKDLIQQEINNLVIEHKGERKNWEDLREGIYFWG